MFKDIKSLLPKTAQRTGISKKMEQEEIRKFTTKILAEFFDAGLVSRIKPLYIYDKVLTVAALPDDAAAAIRKKETMILRRMNEILGQNTIGRIRVLT